MPAVTLPKVPRRDDVIVSTEAIRSAAQAAAEKYGPSPRMVSAIWLAYVTGAREGEVAALRWSDVDLDNGSFRVERSIGETNGAIYVKDTKTGDRRTGSLDEPELVELLRDLQTDQRAYAEQVGVELVADPYFVTDEATRGLPTSSVHDLAPMARCT